MYCRRAFSTQYHTHTACACTHKVHTLTCFFCSSDFALIVFTFIRYSESYSRLNIKKSSIFVTCISKLAFFFYISTKLNLAFRRHSLYFTVFSVAVEREFVLVYMYCTSSWRSHVCISYHKPFVKLKTTGQLLTPSLKLLNLWNKFCSSDVREVSKLWLVHARSEKSDTYLLLAIKFIRLSPSLHSVRSSVVCYIV